MLTIHRSNLVLRMEVALLFAEDFEDYCNRVEKSHEWGGQLEVSVQTHTQVCE